MISPELFKQAEEARASTGFGRRNPNGNKLNNLFEKRTHCAHCGGILGVRNGRNESKAFFCRNKSEGRGCDTPNMNYDENMLLKKISEYRWEEYFKDPRHDAQRASLAPSRAIAREVNTAQGIVDNLNKSIDEEVLAGDQIVLQQSEPPVLPERSKPKYGNRST